jgi:rhomboid protease GluP
LSPESEQNDPILFVRDLNRSVKKPWVVYALVAANVVAFAYEVLAGGVHPLSPTPFSLVQWGANFGPMTLGSEPWRMLTSMFLHVGVIHLLFNMQVLYRSGPLVEKLFGSVPFTVLYVLAGLGGTLTSLALRPTVVSAGASGAIFGLFGGLGAYLLRYRRLIPREVVKSLASGVGQFVVLNVVLGFLIPQIDMGAHLGGLATGFVVGLPLALPLVGTDGTKRLTRALMTLVAASFVLATVYALLRA